MALSILLILRILTRTATRMFLRSMFMFKVNRSSARSPNAALLADTQLPPTPATGDELLPDAFKRFRPISVVART